MDLQEVEAFFDGAMSTAIDSAYVPGAVVVVVKDGEVLLSKGYGYADLEKRIPVNPATSLFRSGSVSKLFTWTAVIQLVEQGPLSLDEDMNTYISARINYSTFEKIFGLFRPVWISMNKNGLVTISGIESRIVETEPGVLEDVNNPASRLVLRQLNGHVMLVSGAPMVFLKIPRYADPSFQLALSTTISLFFLESIFQWAVSFFRDLRCHEKHPLGMHLARLGMILFGLSFLAFLVAVLAAFLDINPALNMPNAIFRVTPALSLALAIPSITGLLWLVILVFTVLAWIKKYWTVKARLHYSLLTLAGTGILWMMIYWNFLL
ncbi:MAG TPA: serine hydrolase domain-containing protein [Anaerolineaceae bacterium]|nr:serine hydrolase domain-containing protein [Anaerolineaceae bacterium]HPN53154.1 serine hydrolase domain-containing protein [Anaerolineaceae bacterium]